MFDPESKSYAQNSFGQPEFDTIILTIDEISGNPELGDIVVQKFVLSSQDALDALVANAIYFGQPNLLATPTHGRLLRQSGEMSDPVFVYVTPREGTIQVIASMQTWNNLVSHPEIGDGSAMVATDKLQKIVADAIAAAANSLGGIPNLLLLDLSSERVAQEQAPGGHSSDDAMTGATGGNAAEAMAADPSVVEERHS